MAQDTQTTPVAMKEAFRTQGTRRNVPAGSVLLHAGDQSTHVYLLESGRVRFTLLSAAGREPILSEIGEGGLFGELAAIDGQPRSAIATAQTDSVIHIMSAADFLTHLKDDWDSTLWVLGHISARLRQTTQRNFQLSTMPVSARLACELLTLMKRPENKGSLISKMPTHSDLAARIGTHREAVTRELGKLANAGIIEKSGRRLDILDVDRLHDHIEDTQR